MAETTVPIRPTLSPVAQQDIEERLQRVSAVVGPMLSRTLMSDELQRSFRMLSEAVNNSYAPMMRTVAELAKTMEPMLRFQKQMADMAMKRQQFLESITAPTIYEPIHYVPEHEQRPIKVTVELTEKHCEMIGNTVATALIERGVTMQVHTTSAQIDLTYDRKTRTLTRRVGTAERSVRFDGKEDNKRRELFEKLVRSHRGVSTQELRDYLDCPNTDATYKVIQGLNKKIADNLGLTMNIADGSDKGGYRIHAQVAIHEM